MSKQSLKSIDKLTSIANDQAIGLCLVAAGESLGAYTTSDTWERTTCASVMDKALRSAMDLGLTVDALKAGKQGYLAFVDSIQNVRIANGMEPLVNATRDNYMSRIRTFVSARGAEPLDVFGNLKAAAQKAERERKAAEAKKLTGDTIDAAKESSDETESDPVTITQPKVVELRGAPALGQFLAAWIEGNDGNNALLKIRTMAEDLLNQINVATGVRSGA